MTLMDTAAARTGLPRRPEGDFYATPAHCTEALLAVDPPPRGAVFEPAAGDGAIAKVLAAQGYDIYASDLHDRGFCSAGIDFLTLGPPVPPAIVTNPPFKQADQFALHALSLGCTYVAMFQRLAWLEGARRHAKLWQPHPPARIWVFSSRQTLWRGDDPDARSTGGAIPFAWFVWDRTAPPGPPRLGWLQTRKQTVPAAADLL